MQIFHCLRDSVGFLLHGLAHMPGMLTCLLLYHPPMYSLEHERNPNPKNDRQKLSLPCNDSGLVILLFVQLVLVSRILIGQPTHIVPAQLLA